MWTNLCACVFQVTEDTEHERYLFIARFLFFVFILLLPAGVTDCFKYSHSHEVMFFSFPENE